MYYVVKRPGDSIWFFEEVTSTEHCNGHRSYKDVVTVHVIPLIFYDYTMPYNLNRKKIFKGDTCYSIAIYGSEIVEKYNSLEEMVAAYFDILLGE